MNVSRNCFFFMTIVLASSALSAQQGTSNEKSGVEPAKQAMLISFEQAVSKAAANQPLILKAEAAVQSAEARVGQAQSEYMPQMSGQASYNFMNPKQYIDIGSESVQTYPENAYDFHLDAGILVYDFGKRELKLKLAQNAVNSALIGVDRIKQNIAYEAARIYYNLICLKEVVQALDEQIASLNDLLGSAKKREADGSATHMDVLIAQIHVRRAANKRTEAATALVKQKIALGQIIGLAPDAAFDVTGNYELVHETRDEQTLIAIALASRPEMQAALRVENAEELRQSLADVGNYPSISMHGQVGYRNGLLTATDQNANTLTFNWGVGVLMTMPIFDGFRTDKEKEEAAAEAEVSHQASEEQRRAITIQVLQALQDLSANQTQAANIQSQVEEAQEVFNMKKIQYELGAGSTTEYIDALDSLSATKIDNFNAQLKEAQSGLDFRETLGEKIWFTE